MSPFATLFYAALCQATGGRTTVSANPREIADAVHIPTDRYRGVLEELRIFELIMYSLTGGEMVALSPSGSQHCRGTPTPPKSDA
jgi:hypothetical protein